MKEGIQDNITLNNKDDTLNVYQKIELLDFIEKDRSDKIIIKNTNDTLIIYGKIKRNTFKTKFKKKNKYELNSFVDDLVSPFYWLFGATNSSTIIRLKFKIFAKNDKKHGAKLLISGSYKSDQISYVYRGYFLPSLQ